jgi:hypothetical protein
MNKPSPINTTPTFFDSKFKAMPTVPSSNSTNSLPILHQIGKAHLLTPITLNQLVIRLLPEKKKKKNKKILIQ